MSMVRNLLIGATTLVTSASLILVPAGAAHAVDDFTALNNCAAGGTESFNSGTFAAGGNNHTRFDLPDAMFHNDAFRITAFGYITIDYWSTRKDVGGDATPAGSDWPKPGVNQYMLLAKVDKGEVFIGRVRFRTNEWFPVGRDSGCIRYVRTTPITDENPSAFLTFRFNDPNIGDNGGFGNVRVRQWFCAICV
ncbi:MAG TPA: hypothetical protein VFC19_23415 [Candidatus Limnocylindrales bacterium]|nr:hypothetical protein [Candidatus Limnocylindrales bacterium]